MAHRSIQPRSVEPPSYLWPAVRSIVGERQWPDKRAFDASPGDSYVSHALSEIGFTVARAETVPHDSLAIEDLYAAGLLENYGRFPVVLCLEGLPDCYDPVLAMAAVLSLLGDGGIAIVSTPFHGYWKNLGLALAGRVDLNSYALTVGNHIKRFSKTSLGRLVHASGGVVERWVMAGRVYPFSKSMIAVIRRA